jgi:hypothetical protein
VVISDITDKVDVAENGINWIILSYWLYRGKM